MASYSPDFKEQIVKKMIPPHNRSVADISAECGISRASLYRWKNEYRSKGFVVPSKKTLPNDWDAKAKLAAIIKTASMNEAERSEYCRANGLYVEQLNEWQEDFESMGSEPSFKDKRELAQERKRVKKLERELTRKDRALAETAALLALSKKAQAIWGIQEED